MEVISISNIIREYYISEYIRYIKLHNSDDKVVFSNRMNNVAKAGYFLMMYPCNTKIHLNEYYKKKVITQREFQTLSQLLLTVGGSNGTIQ